MSRFDEEPDTDPHGECREEIHRLQTENAALREEIDSLKAHIAAGARQGPVAWKVHASYFSSRDAIPSGLLQDAVPLYAAPSSPTAWNPLTDDDRAAAFGSLPDMLDGFLKKWGWLHFAKEIERRCKEKNAPKEQAK